VHRETVDMDISEPHVDPIKLLLISQHVGITLGLGPVNGIGVLFQIIEGAAGGFDLFHYRGRGLLQHTVDATRYDEIGIARPDQVAHRHFGPVSIRSAALNMLMGPDPFDSFDRAEKIMV
jgi:hypothetical protein